MLHIVASAAGRATSIGRMPKHGERRVTKTATVTETPLSTVQHRRMADATVNAVELEALRARVDGCVN